MNPPDQPTQPTEAHRKLAAEIIFEAESLYPKAMIPIAAQLIADSEARAVESAQKHADIETERATHYRDQWQAERERVRLLSEHGIEALMVARSWQMVWGDKLSPDSVAIFTKHEQAFLAGLAATEAKT
jgi:hypothetical protein